MNTWAAEAQPQLAPVEVAQEEVPESDAMQQSSQGRLTRADALKRAAEKDHQAHQLHIMLFDHHRLW